MKICVLGLDCAAPEVIFGDERLVNIRRLMEAGVYGRLESVIPPITVPAWMCMCTSQDPGSLGVYGFRNRSDYSYDKLHFVNSASIKALAIWDQLAREGKKSIIMGVPPNYPARKINGISVGCFLTPDTVKNDFTWPTNIKQEINQLVGEYPVDVKGFRTDNKEWLREQIFEMSRKHWEVVRWLIREKEWDYFHYVDIGLDRVHHGFWNFFDKQHVDYEAGNPFESVVPDYYLWLDEQIGSVLELLDQDTMVLLVSDHGAQRLNGGFAINEWLIREGLLVLKRYPDKITQFSELDVDWGQTRVWSEGGYYARVFFNVEGREPNGIIRKTDVAAFQNEMKAKLEALCDATGAPMSSLVFKPEDVYRTVRNVAPDLIVHFGGLFWRSIGSVGHKQLHVRENDTGPDGCNHAQHGMFILAAPNCPMQGEYTGAHLLDIAPTLLDLVDSERPESMQGRALFAGMERKPRDPDESTGYEKIIHDRLAGLGYV